MSETNYKSDQDESSVSSSESYPALQWREEPPKKEGHYWCKLVSQNYAELPMIVYVHFEDGEMYVTENKNTLHIDDFMPDHLFGHAEWAGPIPEPCESEAEGAV
ncbi:hypothetical protein OSG_eHP7_00120 [environmental Halophage eHP-7]|jgi:hypothetical protein|nr:hypothetical protein OSG_eHP7_00120 [environmental Halophage eHP-7]